MSRFADVVIAALLLLITLPLLILVALAIRWDSPGPILVRHSCVGSGRRFQILEFRTVAHGPDHRSASDVRITRVGGFLRYTRIDTLPQLINVLRGEMSLLDRNARSPSFLN